VHNLIIRHKVKDFTAWNAVFQAHEAARVAAGLTRPRLFRSADDPAEVVILFDVADIATAKAVAGSAELQAAMMAAGVMDKPDAYFLNAVS
jgi:hypothetical protein